MLDSCIVLTLLFTLVVGVEGGLRCEFKQRDAEESFLAMNPELVNGTSPFLNGKVRTYEKCQSGLMPLYNETVVPWSYECPTTFSKKDRGPRFFPRHAVYARCLCDSCIRKTNTNCGVVIRVVKVLYIDNCSDDGIASFTYKSYNVPVACECTDRIGA
ncbi:uncharacterized protein LOC131946062 [Physella acuta]|uniref:uncharacterized protein LOC131946062 n=1 Tax=Physella acuta TaxID=109671 RepID=UPI0027DAF247|nr:uncharacterized protein LOC131946062 [Physella acuta]